MTPEFWKGRRVLITGNTGFKGSWAARWLHCIGADVSGLALPPATSPSLWGLIGAGIRCSLGDVRDVNFVQRVLRELDPEIVIHMAAQALVQRSYRDPLTTYATNVIGTCNVLDACRESDRIRCILVVTSDKVYEQRPYHEPFLEGDRLGGHDPYSNSKACTELVAQSFRDCFFVGKAPIATVRAGNVIGGGDWSEDRLIPDCLRALARGEPVQLRYPGAVRPWQHVLDPLAGYLTFIEALMIAPESTPRALNFGPDSTSFCTVQQVVEAFSERFDGRPGWVSDTSDHLPEARSLTLDSTLAKTAIRWRPRLSLDAAIAWTAQWHAAHRSGENMLAYSMSQISQYTELMQAG